MHKPRTEGSFNQLQDFDIQNQSLADLSIIPPAQNEVLLTIPLGASLDRAEVASPGSVGDRSRASRHSATESPQADPEQTYSTQQALLYGDTWQNRGADQSPSSSDDSALYRATSKDGQPSFALRLGDDSDEDVVEHSTGG